MKAEGFTATEAGELLAFGREAAEATGRIRRWRMAGLLPPAGQDIGGRCAAFRFDKAQIAVAAVAFWAFDHAGIERREHLAGLITMLSHPRPGGEMALIDAILTDIEQDGSPVVVLTRWINPKGETGLTFEVRLTHELDRPIIAPGDEFQPIMDGVLSLAPLLDSFVGATVIPFRKREAS
ncbi:MAG: hypothetical protein AB7O04_01695 [Hyphomonadaceae bacterium]